MLDQSDLITLIASQILITGTVDGDVPLTRINCSNARMEAQYIVECLARTDEEWAKVNQEDTYYLGSLL